MDEIERRILNNEKDIALVAQRIDIHERECMEKHETVIKTLTTTNLKIDQFKDNHNRWMKGIMATLIIACLTVIITLLTKT